MILRLFAFVIYRRTEDSDLNRPQEPPWPGNGAHLSKRAFKIAAPPADPADIRSGELETMIVQPIVAQRCPGDAQASWAGLASGFLQSCDRFPDSRALVLDDVVLSYAQLREHAAALAATLMYHAADGPLLTAVFANRSLTAYAGLLAALFRGHGYVPLNHKLPAARTTAMLRQSGCTALIVDQTSESQLPDVLSGVDHAMTVLLPHRREAQELIDRWPAHHFVAADGFRSADSWEPAAVSSDALAYLLFTSGSTGDPKGVMVTQRNVLAFVEAMVERYGFDESDRVAQVSDLTFDLSIMGLFVPWQQGACLCCPTDRQVTKPGRFITQNELTTWISVPSVITFMKRLGELKPGRHATLRRSLFCGEALSLEAAHAWQAAAPNSIVENLYGPTELTVACSYYRYDVRQTPLESLDGIVPIGEPFPKMTFRVVDDSLQDVVPGETGELIATGPQLSLGYWGDSNRTATAFLRPPDSERTFYCTGDLVRSPINGEPMTYVGRKDQQIKILGYRIELGEVEAVLRDVVGVSIAVAVGWPRTSSGAEGIVAFLGTDTADLEDVERKVRHRLPEYMVPREYRLVPDIPLSTNGKVDRQVLLATLEAEK
ncbi:MAG: amino acid adenylation domain-containing protein [Phycisphaerales bacterium]|nr:amino acid adenylation domain-containing protein [Phycisphaerales bacterium]